MRDKKKTIGIVLAAAICISLSLTGFAGQAGEMRESADPQETVNIGVSSMIAPVDAVKYYQEIIDYVGERIHRPVRMVHRRTYGEMDDLLERGKVNVAFICSAPYVKNREKFGVELLVAPSVSGSTRYHSYIIVHKDSPLASFAELKGKAFAFTDPKSNTGKLYPTYLLKTLGATPERFFRRHSFSYSHNKSVEQVAKKIVDGAAVENLVYEYLRKQGSPYVALTKVIEKSPAFGMPPVVVTKGIDPVLKNGIKNAFLGMHKDPRGKAILDAMMIDSFSSVSDGSYDSIREMERAVSESAPARRNGESKKTVHIGALPRDNPRIMYEKYQPLLDYLGEKTPYSFDLVLKKNYEETVRALGNGEIDLAFLGPLTYLEARAKYGAVCILRPRGADNRSAYRSVIIKKRESPVMNLTELKGKSVAFAATKSTSGNLIPRYLLANAGIHLGDLKRYDNFSYHDSVVKAILKGQYDAGAVRDSVARKYSRLGIEVIAESEDIPTGPLVIGPGTPFAAVEAIKKALLELTPADAVRRAILGRFDDELKNGFTEAADSDYAEIRAKINAVPRTCGRGCHPKIKL
ncbi:MAG: phosphate/phosphite/phosphonate ABC transporter substrate-binding protein [Nitrospirota bacterium]